MNNSIFVSPSGNMRMLSSEEISMLQDASQKGIYNTFRKCALAVLNCNNQNDNARHLMKLHENFDIKLHRKPRGLTIELINPPKHAFVDDKLILGVRENLVSILRDIIYATNEYRNDTNPTDRIFKTLRNAEVFIPGKNPSLVVCWGGHSISNEEYEYSKKVGYQLGLRGIDLCTGSGPGAMEGPMKGACMGHVSQRYSGRFIGISEPSIIASETPNPIINNLVIMPDMEKRLESFIRLSHGIIVFPGGVGTLEEILYLLGILLHPDNKNIPLPLILTGPKSSVDYFTLIDKFIKLTLGDSTAKYYEIIINDPKKVADKINSGLKLTKSFRRLSEDAYYFNSNLQIKKSYQKRFVPTHKIMSRLEITYDLDIDELALNLRAVMSGIVSGNIKQEGIIAIEKHGPFQIKGDPILMEIIDQLLSSFIDENRMTIPGKESYKACYEIIK